MGGRPGLLWVSSVFAAEFGTSDVQANYSRLYSWMANQLGHMTLGLATALAFLWLHETVHDAVRPIASDLPRPEAGLPYLLLCLTLGVIVGAAILALLLAHRDAPEPIAAAEHCGRIDLLPRRPARALALSLALALALAAIAVTLAALGQPGEPRANLLAAATASLLLAAPVAILSTDRRATALGLLALAGAFLLAADPGAIPFRTALAALLAAAFAGLAATRLDRSGIALTLAGAAAFLAAIAADPAPDWRLGLAGALAALALWWVKEFGSDMPLVSDEIVRAARERRAHGQPDHPELERLYFADALWDARTDGAFYVAGAAIAVGIATTSAALPGSDWMSGAELVGLIAFALVFLWFGRRWAYRQQALDRMAAPFASRLAVFENAVALSLPDPDGGTRPLDRPLDRLLDFAHGRLAGPDGRPVRHLAVFGGLSSGKTPLGLAIASEAALRDLPPRLDWPWDPPLGPPERWRSARYVTQRGLVARANLSVEASRPGEAEPGIAPLRPTGDRPAASLVVIDEAGLASRDELAVLAGQLASGSGQQTVWLLEAPGVPDFAPGRPWQPVPTPQMRAFLDDLAAVFGDRTETVATAFVARRGRSNATAGELLEEGVEAVRHAAPPAF
jgi:hypothetical protein